MSSGEKTSLLKKRKRVRSDRLGPQANEICALPNGPGVRGRTPLVLEAIPGMSEIKRLKFRTTNDDSAPECRSSQWLSLEWILMILEVRIWYEMGMRMSQSLSGSTWYFRSTFFERR